MIKCNSFVQRQTLASPFSCFTGTWEELEAMAETALAEGRERAGYRQGIVLVSVDPDRFYTGVVALHDGDPFVLTATFAARRPDEVPFIDVRASSGEKLRAKHVDLVLYSHETLGGEAATIADWEIVSINARSTEAPEPMSPVAMARNFLELAGGTKATYTAQEFAEAIDFWSRHAMFGGPK
jgi:hypothetical protein